MLCFESDPVVVCSGECTSKPKHEAAQPQLRAPSQTVTNGHGEPAKSQNRQAGGSKQSNRQSALNTLDVNQAASGQQATWMEEDTPSHTPSDDRPAEGTPRYKRVVDITCSLHGQKQK